MLAALALALACGHVVAHISPAPPAPIVAQTGCGIYEIDPDGSVSVHPGGSAPAWAPHAVSHPGPGVWVAHPHGRLAVYRDGGLLWRSRIQVPSDEVVVHGSSIAFGLYARDESPTLWMARVGGGEFRVAAGEEPVGWTAGGLVTQHGNRIRVRGPDGTLYRTVARGHSPAYDAADRTVVFVSRNGDLVRTDGRTLWRLVRALRHSAWVTVLGNRLLQVTDGDRVLYLRPTGSLLGIGPLPAGGIVGLPGGGGVVFVTNTRRQSRGAASAGINVVELLDASGRIRRLYRHAVPYAGCGEWANVSYAKGRILFTDSEGPAAIIDPTGSTPPLDLSPAFRVLQPDGASLARLYADWLANWR